ncbi:MAG: phosphoenolpyruvate carboxykinase (GTP) [Hadesarchaea archaeon]|nr:phosphoenolpyruvate carboxykinase (GTP) [Hadesarchaea archaeon]
MVEARNIEKKIVPKTQNKEKLLKEKCGKKDYEKLTALNNPLVTDFIANYVKHCNPESVFVRANDKEDTAYIRRKAIENGEERELKIDGHTVHFDGYNDQGRDKENTKFLVPKNKSFNSQFNTIDKEEGLIEIHEYLENIMEGKEAYVCFFCLGPANSPFTIPGIQITDSAYVAHSEDILYRDGYDYFKSKNFEDKREFFKFVHSAGELENNVSKEIDKRRIYTNLEKNTVYSTNTQYGGNTIGLKKLALRLAIKKASREGWLAEHMFVMGVHGPEDRVSYFSGAYPSACGKTSTAMTGDESLIGDDIAYLREIDGEVRAANPEVGIFGIIRDVSPEKDPLIWNAITTPGEVIFSNVLVKDGKPYWLGMGRDLPDKGINFSGEWWKGKEDSEGREIPPAHPNARYNLPIANLEVKDPKLNDPEGAMINGIIYGGRDSDTWVPVEESFSWEHGIVTKGASLESETTSATLGKAGVRKLNPMSNLDFLSIPIGKYIKNQIDFGEKLERPPSIFSVNYFLKNEEGEYLNAIHDKRVWLKWMELRVHRDLDAIKTPTGLIPKFEDLKRLFKKVLDKDYPKRDYIQQFTLRVPEHLEKIDRIREFYEEEIENPPQVVFDELAAQERRLKDAKNKYGSYISPERFR